MKTESFEKEKNKTRIFSKRPKSAEIQVTKWYDKLTRNETMKGCELLCFLAARRTYIYVLTFP